MGSPGSIASGTSAASWKEQAKQVGPFFLFLKKEDNRFWDFKLLQEAKPKVSKPEVSQLLFQGGSPEGQLRRKTCWPGTSWLKMPWWKRISTWCFHPGSNGPIVRATSAAALRDHQRFPIKDGMAIPNEEL